MQPERVMRGLAAVIRRQGADRSLRKSTRDFLADAGVHGRDLDQLSKLGTDRLLVYRRLVHNRFLDAVKMSVPRTQSRRGEAGIEQDVTRFLDEQGSRSPYLRDIASEFITWVTPSWEADPEVPGYLPDLARHELLSFETGSVPVQSGGATAQLDLERPVSFEGSTRVVRYAYAVHRLPEDEDDETEPKREDTALLAYRDAEHRVRYLELGAVAALVLELLLGGIALGPAIERACADSGITMDDDLLGGMAQLLAELAQRGVLLGAS